MAIEAWYIEENDEDQKLPPSLNPQQFLSLEFLADHGVQHWKLDPKNFENDPALKAIVEARGYDFTDLLDIHPERMENFAEKAKDFFTEHIHEIEEIPYCLDGSGYIDIRDKDDRWIRIWMKPGDMISVPAGIYHRLVLDSGNYMKVMRFTEGESKWTAHNRPQEHHPIRKSYINNFIKKAGATNLQAL